MNTKGYLHFDLEKDEIFFARTKGREDNKHSYEKVTEKIKDELFGETYYLSGKDYPLFHGAYENEELREKLLNKMYYGFIHSSEFKELSGNDTEEFLEYLAIWGEENRTKYAAPFLIEELKKYI